jgi:hypothetical protein
VNVTNAAHPAALLYLQDRLVALEADLRDLGEFVEASGLHGAARAAGTLEGARRALERVQAALDVPIHEAVRQR